MKKMYGIFATMFALALVAASPVGTLTACAEGLGFNPNAHDSTERGEMPDDYWESKSSSSSESNTPAPAPNVDSSSNNNGGSSSSGGSSSNNEVNNNGSGLGFNPDAHDDTNRGEMPDDYWSKNDPNDVATKVEGGQTFRSVMNKEHTQYDVYHKGSSVAAFSVTDKDGKRVEFKTVTLEKGEDGLWYLNITFAEGVDVKGLVLNLLKGDLAYLARELGITGIQINGEVVMLTNPETVDADAGTGKESDNKAVEEEKKDDKVVADGPVVTEEPAGYRVCWCGHKMPIETAGGLSDSEKAEWKAHASAHMKNGERTNYTDIVNKNTSK